jgi:diguanylate cyclase (GGDEF)-like protein
VGDNRSALFQRSAGDYQFEVRAILPGTGTPPVIATHTSSSNHACWSARACARPAAGAAPGANRRAVAHIALRRQRERLLDEVAEKTLALERLASTDALTGLANRRVFDSSLARALASDGRPALLLFDVDHFKRYNDALGHQAGDQCLSSIGAMLVHGAPRKPAARLAVKSLPVVANADSAVAATLAEACSQLRERAIAHRFTGIEQVTVSIGYACAHPGSASAVPARRPGDVSPRARDAIGRLGSARGDLPARFRG